MALKKNDNPDDSRPDQDDSSSSEDEEYQDAMENLEADEGASRYSMDLSTSLEQCEVALNRFLNNDLQGAMAIMRPWSRTSLYHSLATSIFEFIPAVLTLDPRQVEVALASIKHTLTLCQQFRRSYSLVESLGTIIRKPNFSTFTELEAHAELCYAETLLLQAALALLDGEDLAGLVRATLKVKASHNSYKNCERILEQRQWNEARTRRDFESGVHLGIATFRTVVSLLPPRLATLLSFAGFSANRAAGIAGLERGSLAGGLRAPLCDLTLLAVQLVMMPFVAMDPDMVLAQRILLSRLQQFPDGAFFLIFLGRMQLLRGDTTLALSTYTRVAGVPRVWPQLRHLTYWECMWACSIELRWRVAAQFAARLLNESAWSRTVYAYAQAAFLLQLDDITPAEKEEAAQLLRRAASYRQRIAGKSLPMEKFIIRRCHRWTAHKELVLPGLELLCLWNLFPALAADDNRARAALQIIDEAAGRTRRPLGSWPQQLDSQALVHYLRGALQMARHRERDALPALERVIALRDHIQDDTFLVPYALYEIACCQITLGDHIRGQNTLRDIRRNFSSYLLESRLQFRLHSRLAMIPEVPGEEELAEEELAAEQQDALERQNPPQDQPDQP